MRRKAGCRDGEKRLEGRGSCFPSGGVPDRLLFASSVVVVRSGSKQRAEGDQIPVTNRLIFKRVVGDEPDVREDTRRHSPLM